MTLRNLLIALFAVAVVACSSSTDPNEEEPEPEPETTVIGTWQLNEDNTVAEWIGKEGAKAKANDTLMFTTPEGNTLEMVHQGKNDFDETEEVVDLTYTDSTITQDTVDTHNLNFITGVEYYFEGVEIGPKPYRLNVKTTEAFDDYIETRFQFLYTCGNGQNIEEIGFDYHSEEGHGDFYHYKSVRLTTDGFHTVVDSVFCGD